jgi:hypothetical protein
MEYLSNIISAVFFNTTLLVVWFLTNAYYEYLNIVIPFIFKDYKSYISSNRYIYYTEYLESKDGFIYKLLSCPFCLGFWSSVFSSAIYNSLEYVCVIYIISLMIYFIIKQKCCN